MNIRFYSIGIAAIFAAAIAPALASTSPWNGTWTLDKAKSQMTGDTFTYSMNSNGTIRYTNGGTVQFNFACDGKDYPEVADYTTACEKISATVYAGTDKQNGKVLSKWRRVLSADGKTMTITSTGTQPDGTSYTNVSTYERVSGTSGLAGEWKNVKATSSAAGVMTIAVSGTAITMGFPGYKQSVTAKLGGGDAPLTGPTLPAGVTMSFKASGPHQLSSVTAFKGKVFSEDAYTLSADGKTITDVTSTPGQNGKQTYVYEKH